ncbi:MAG TPA: folylpolyglutamate synthase/dihydrofolate synthase family protein [Pyrinomonadaceae bacterium]|jgi:dihydrofolate synthase/folylpolyglutamate synthase|nr:folylpolyglutamate synthase/dihydrofolate synthase family protein [Pyrinomonadaceae bacterium]
MNFDQALSYLLGLGHETLTIKLGLQNTETLLAALGNPQRNYQSVQIAGTNGKGSTAAFLDSICRAAGIRTGLFTSPHLLSITERIKVDGQPISETQFARLTGLVKAVADQLIARGELPTAPTFFEHVTAIALLAFAKARVELAILETGLGGRLDSTTAARASVVALTPIAMDHEEYLGRTIELIASEKAAIIREGVTAIVGSEPDEALDVILKRCQECRLDPVLASGECEIEAVENDGRLRVNLSTASDDYHHVLLRLRGRYQIDNAMIAVASAEALRERGFEIMRDAIVSGLERATHPGRLEWWPGQCAILFDGAHNPAAAQALRDYLDEFVSQPIIMIFGAMRDKRLDEMAEVLFSKAHQLILTKIDNPRAASLEELELVAQLYVYATRVHQASSPAEALRLARELTSAEDLIVVTGSLYLVGEVQKILESQMPAIASREVGN